MRRKKHPKTYNDKKDHKYQASAVLIPAAAWRAGSRLRLGLRGIAFSLMPEDGFYHRWP